MRRFEKDSRLVLAQPFAQSEVTACPVRIEQIPRPLKRLVQREVVDAIAAAIIDGTVREGDQVTVDVDKDGGFTVVCDNTPTPIYEAPEE